MIRLKIKLTRKKEQCVCSQKKVHQMTYWNTHVHHITIYNTKKKIVYDKDRMRATHQKKKKKLQTNL